mmetsp:Transcript_23101/g.73940  ORF Transcript_23101/g.73940 Transcript_23101/m.73940 type:complete len:421 (-) Transcript_23101:1006-2268(-)
MELGPQGVDGRLPLEEWRLPSVRRHQGGGGSMAAPRRSRRLDLGRRRRVDCAALRVAPLRARRRCALRHRLPQRAVRRGPLAAQEQRAQLRPPVGLHLVGVVQHGRHVLPCAAGGDRHDGRVAGYDGGDQGRGAGRRPALLQPAGGHRRRVGPPRPKVPPLLPSQAGERGREGRLRRQRVAPHPRHPRLASLLGARLPRAAVGRAARLPRAAPHFRRGLAKEPGKVLAAARGGDAACPAGAVRPALPLLHAASARPDAARAARAGARSRGQRLDRRRGAAVVASSQGAPRAGRSPHRSPAQRHRHRARARPPARDAADGVLVRARGVARRAAARLHARGRLDARPARLSARERVRRRARGADLAKGLPAAAAVDLPQQQHPQAACRRPPLHAGRHHRRPLAGGGAAAWPPAAAGSAAGVA